jgi:hypothetical protein
MLVRTFPLLFAMLVLALWPQGITLCLAESGHVEIEVEGAPCCPDEEGDCEDCLDIESPDLRIVPSVTATSPAALHVLPIGTPAPTRLEPAVVPNRESCPVPDFVVLQV